MRTQTELSRMRRVAEDFVDYLTKRRMFESGIAIYADGGRISCEKQTPDDIRCRTGRRNTYWFTPETDCPCEMSNPDTLTATFEGAFNHALNYHDYQKTNEDLCKILKPYGLYYEQGYAWSFTLYEN